MSDRDEILVVDDQVVNRAILREIFRKDFKIVEAQDGKEAIHQINHHKNKLAMILLDVIMPVLDGFEVMNYMKGENLENTIPVIMITADSSYETEIKGYNYRVADILAKPFHVNVVKRRVNNIIELYNHKRNLELTVEEQMFALEKQYFELQKKKKEIEDTQDAMTEALSNIVEFRNNESGGHIRRIKNYTSILANYIMLEFPKYGLNRDNINLIAKASAMHDVGKISISDTILLKPGRLTQDEFEVMKSHTVIGCDILENFDFIKDREFFFYSYDICRHHHERVDGSGYPDKLKGDEISIAAQIVSVADVYDALVSRRCYKGVYSHQEAVDMIVNGECGEFGNEIMKCFTMATSQFQMISG